MKRIAIVVLCALALMSCKKENPKEDFKVSPEYTASTFFSMKPDMLVTGSLPSAVDYFNLKVKELNDIQFFSQTFDGEDPQSEERAYQQADKKAEKYVSELKAKAKEKYDEILNTIQTTDIGNNNIRCTFSYSFGREDKVLDSFEEEIIYIGGTRFKSDEVELSLSSSGIISQRDVKIPEISNMNYSLACSGDIKLCLPDNTYADKSIYGQMVTVKEFKIIEENGKKYHEAKINLVVDEAHMANVKSKAGNWHALVPVTASNGSKSSDIIVYIPINISVH